MMRLDKPTLALTVAQRKKYVVAKVPKHARIYMAKRIDAEWSVKIDI